MANPKNKPIDTGHVSAPALLHGSGASGRYAYDGLDRVIHEKARLGIVTSLATHPQGLLFGDLKELCSLTDGNLSRHLQVLHEAGLVEVWKGSQGNRPQTLCRLTGEGRRRFLDYITVLENVVTDALSVKPAAPPALSEGWSPA
jgi:DNA-binding MarR family transcriptional regulator